MFRSIKKIFKFGLQNFARNFWLAILTITILALLLVSINILIIMNFLTDEASRQMQAKVDITIYLKPKATDAEAQSLRSYLAGLPAVSSAVYTNAEDTLKQFKDRHKDNSEILSSLDIIKENPFGGYIILQTVNVDDYKKVLSQLESQVYKSIIENKDFDDHERLVGVINDITGKVKQLVVVVSAFFALIAIVIVFNTVKIAIYTHREEIAIMNLVGASRWFIAGQFIFEVIFYGFLSTAIVFILIFPTVSLAQPKIFEFFNQGGGDVFAYYRRNILPLFATQFLIVAALSSVSAFFAITRHLKK